MNVSKLYKVLTDTACFRFFAILRCLVVLNRHFRLRYKIFWEGIFVTANGDGPPGGEDFPNIRPAL